MTIIVRGEKIVTLKNPRAARQQVKAEFSPSIPDYPRVISVNISFNCSRVKGFQPNSRISIIGKFSTQKAATIEWRITVVHYVSASPHFLPGFGFLDKLAKQVERSAADA